MRRSYCCWEKGGRNGGECGAGGGCMGDEMCGRVVE